jgi:hypothetical protein
VVDFGHEELEVIDVELGIEEFPFTGRVFPAGVFAHVFLAAVFTVRFGIGLVFENDFEVILIGKVEDFVDIDGRTSSEMPEVTDIVLEMKGLLDELLENVGFGSVGDDEISLIQFVNKSDRVLHSYFATINGLIT